MNEEQGGAVMEERINEGYKIINAIPIGNTEFVLGANMKNPDMFVTWECKDKTDYFWGHYYDSVLSATKDLCQRVMDEALYLEQREQKQRMTPSDPDSGYRIIAFVKHGNSSAAIQFPTRKLQDILGSIGIKLPPERVYLKGHDNIEIHLQRGESKVADELVHLFQENNSLRMVNEVAKAVFHSDYRVYDRVKENLDTDYYKSAEEVLRDAVDYGKYLKDIQGKQKKTSGREER